jgi:hypothetical protein
MPLMMGRNKAFLDFHIFDIPEGEEIHLDWAANRATCQT